MDGLGGVSGFSEAELTQVVKKLSPRWFLLRDAHAQHGLGLLQPRWAMSFMRGPLTRAELRYAVDGLGQARER